MVRKIGEFEKSGVIYKSFLRQTQGTKEKVRKIGNSNNRMFEKSGFNCSQGKWRKGHWHILTLSFMLLKDFSKELIIIIYEIISTNSVYQLI